MDEKLYQQLTVLCTIPLSPTDAESSSAGNQQNVTTVHNLPQIRSELNKNDKMSGMNNLLQTLCSPHAAESMSPTQFNNYLQISVTVLLQYCSDEETQAVKTAADEGLCRIFKTYQCSHCSHIMAAFLSFLRVTSQQHSHLGHSAAFKCALRKLSQLSSVISLNKRRHYALNVIPILMIALESHEESVLESIAKSIGPLTKNILSYANVNEMKNLLKSILPKIHNESVSMRRAAAEIVSQLCEFARQSNILITWLWQTLMDIVIPVDRDHNSVTIHGVLLMMRHLLIVIERHQLDAQNHDDSNNFDNSNNEILSSSQWVATMQLLLHYCESHENMIVTVALETLHQYLRSLPLYYIKLWSCDINTTASLPSVHKSCIFKADVRRSLSRGNSRSSDQPENTTSSSSASLNSLGDSGVGGQTTVGHSFLSMDHSLDSQLQRSSSPTSTTTSSSNDGLGGLEIANDASSTTTPLLLSLKRSSTFEESDEQSGGTNSVDLQTLSSDEDESEAPDSDESEDTDTTSSSIQSDSIDLILNEFTNEKSKFQQNDDDELDKREDCQTLIPDDENTESMKETFRPSADEEIDIGHLIIDSTNNTNGLQQQQPALLYCIRLLAARFLLSGTIQPNQMGNSNDFIKLMKISSSDTTDITTSNAATAAAAALSSRIVPDRLVRVSLKSLALSCITLLVQWAPHYLLQTLFVSPSSSSSFVSSVKNESENSSQNVCQYLSDLFYLWQHEDPQVAGHSVLLIATFLQAVSRTCDGEHNSLDLHLKPLSQWWQQTDTDTLLPDSLALLPSPTDLCRVVNILLTEKDNGMILKWCISAVEMISQVCSIDSHSYCIHNSNIPFLSAWLSLLNSVLRLYKHKYRLVKKQLLNLLGQLDYSFVIVASVWTKQSSSISLSSSSFSSLSSSLNNKNLQDDCLFTVMELLKDSDPEVRREAIVCIHKLSRRLHLVARRFDLTDAITPEDWATSYWRPRAFQWETIDPHLLGPPIPGLHGVLSLDQIHKHMNTDTLRTSDNVATIIHHIMCKISDFSMVGEQKIALTSYVACLASLCQEFPPLYYANAWNLTPLHILLEIPRLHSNASANSSNPTTNSSSANHTVSASLCDTLLRRSHEWLSSTDLLLDVNFHRDVLLLQSALFTASGLQHLYQCKPVATTTTNKSTPTTVDHRGALCLKDGTWLQQSFQLCISHSMKVLNIMWHIVEDCRPILPPQKMILPNLTGSGTNSSSSNVPVSVPIPQTMKSRSSTHKVIHDHQHKGDQITTTAANVASAGANTVKRSANQAAAVANALLPKREKDGDKDYRPASNANCWGFFYGNSLYNRLHDVLRDTFKGFLINPDSIVSMASNDMITPTSASSTLMTDASVLDLLGACLNNISTLFEFARHFDVASYTEEVLAYLQTLYNWRPTDIVHCVSQLLRVLFGTNVSSLWDTELATFYFRRLGSLYEKQIYELPCLGRSTTKKLLTNESTGEETNEQSLYCELVSDWDESYVHMLCHYGQDVPNNMNCLSVPDNRPSGQTRFQLFPVFEWIRRTAYRRTPAMLRSGSQFTAHKPNLSSYIRMFEAPVFRSLKIFGFCADQSLQEAIVDLLCQLIFLRVNYSTLDSDQRFLTSVLVFMERLEKDEMDLMKSRLLPQLIHFLTLLSYEKIPHPGVGLVFTVSALIRLCETLLANSLEPIHEILPALSPLAADLYVKRAVALTSNFIGNSSLIMDDAGNDLATQRECFLNLLLKRGLLHYSATWDLLMLALQQAAREGEDRWRILSQLCIAQVLPEQKSSALQLYNWLDVKALRGLLSHFHPKELNIAKLLYSILLIAQQQSVMAEKVEFSGKEEISLDAVQYILLEMILPAYREPMGDECKLLSGIHATRQNFISSHPSSTITNINDKSVCVEDFFISLIFASLKRIVDCWQRNHLVSFIKPNHFTKEKRNFLERLQAAYATWLLHIIKYAPQSCPRLGAAVVKEFTALIDKVKPIWKKSPLLACLLQRLQSVVGLWADVTTTTCPCAFFTSSSSTTKSPCDSICLVGKMEFILFCEALVRPHTMKGEGTAVDAVEMRFNKVRELLQSVDKAKSFAWKLMRFHENEIPVRELLLIIHHNGDFSSLYIDACTSIIHNKQHAIQPRDLQKFLHSYNGLHLQSSLSLMKHLIQHFIVDEPLLAIVRRADLILRMRLEMIFNISQEKIEKYLSLNDLIDCQNLLQNGNKCEYGSVDGGSGSAGGRAGGGGFGNGHPSRLTSLTFTRVINKFSNNLSDTSSEMISDSWLGNVKTPDWKDPEWLNDICSRIYRQDNTDAATVADTLQYLLSSQLSSSSSTTSTNSLLTQWFFVHKPKIDECFSLKEIRRWCHILTHCMQVGCERTQAIFHPSAARSVGNQSSEVALRWSGHNLISPEGLAEADSGQVLTSRVDDLFVTSAKSLFGLCNELLSIENRSQELFTPLLYDALATALLRYEDLLQQLPVPLVMYDEEVDNSPRLSASMSYRELNLSLVSMQVALDGLQSLINSSINHLNLHGQAILRLLLRCFRDFPQNVNNNLNSEQELLPNPIPNLNVITHSLWILLHRWNFQHCTRGKEPMWNEEDMNINQLKITQRTCWEAREMLMCILHSDCLHDQPWTRKYLLRILIIECCRHPRLYERLCQLDQYSSHGGSGGGGCQPLLSNDTIVHGLDLDRLGMLDRDGVVDLVCHFSLLGWTLRTQFEEVWTCYLALLNQNSHSSAQQDLDNLTEFLSSAQSQSASQEEMIERSHVLCSSLRGLTHLLLHTIAKPSPGHIVRSHVEHRPRDSLPNFLHTRIGRKLSSVHALIEETEQHVLYGCGCGFGSPCSVPTCPFVCLLDSSWNLEREMRLWGRSVNTQYEHSLVSVSLLSKRLEATTSQWTQSGMLYRPTDSNLFNDSIDSSSGQSTLSTPGQSSSSTSAMPSSHVDTLSCLQFLPQLLSEWLVHDANDPNLKTPPAVRLEAVRAAVMLSDLFTVREQMEWLRDALLHIANSASLSSTTSSSSQTSAGASAGLGDLDPYLQSWLCLGLAKCASVLDVSSANDHNDSSTTTTTSSSIYNVISRWIVHILFDDISPSMAPALHCAALHSAMLLLQTDAHTSASTSADIHDLNNLHRQVLRYLETSLERLCQVGLTSSNNINQGSHASTGFDSSTNALATAAASSASTASSSGIGSSVSSSSTSGGGGASFGSLRRSVFSTITGTASHMIPSKILPTSSSTSTISSNSSNTIQTGTSAAAAATTTSSSASATSTTTTAGGATPTQSSASTFQQQTNTNSFTLDWKRGQDSSILSFPHVVVERYQLTLLSAAIFYCERYPDALRETDIFSVIMKLAKEYLTVPNQAESPSEGGNSSGFQRYAQFTYLSSPAVYISLCRGLERLILSGRLPKMAIDVLYKQSVDQLRSCYRPSSQRSIPSLGLFLTCAYSHASTVMNNSSSSSSSSLSPSIMLHDGAAGGGGGGMFANDPEAQLVALERVGRLFERLHPRRGLPIVGSSPPSHGGGGGGGGGLQATPPCATPAEAQLLVKILPTLLLDFFPPANVINKVLGEFLSTTPTTSNFNVHDDDSSSTATTVNPTYMARLVYEVFQRLIAQGKSAVAIDWVLMSLTAAMRQLPLARAVWTTSTLFLCLNNHPALAAVFCSHVENDGGALGVWQVEVLCASGVHLLTHTLVGEAMQSQRVGLLASVADSMDEKAPFIALHNALLLHSS